MKTVAFRYKKPIWILWIIVSLLLVAEIPFSGDWGGWDICCLVLTIMLFLTCGFFALLPKGAIQTDGEVFCVYKFFRKITFPVSSLKYVTPYEYKYREIGVIDYFLLKHDVDSFYLVYEEEQTEKTILVSLIENCRATKVALELYAKKENAD